MKIYGWKSFRAYMELVDAIEEGKFKKRVAEFGAAFEAQGAINKARGDSPFDKPAAAEGVEEKK